MHMFKHTSLSLHSASRQNITKMVSLEPNSSPRISFSADFLNEEKFISISLPAKEHELEKEKTEFEFLSSNANTHNMLTADELFFEGKVLPFWQMQHSERLSKISLKKKDNAKEGERGEEVRKEESRMNWFVDDDPSPRPPKCTVLWKELLRLKKQRASSLSPSSSSSSSIDEGLRNKEKHVKRIKKARSTSIRIRPMINAPICTHSALPPLFPLKKGRLER